MRFFTFFALVLPLTEIAVMVLVGQKIGVLGVLGLLLLDIVIGVALLRWQGFETLRQVRSAMQRGEAPISELLQGFSLAVAGLLFLLPGFVSDIVAMLLLIPAIRRLIVKRGTSFMGRL